MLKFDADKLQEILETLVEKDRFSGTVLVAKDNEIVFEKAYGMAYKQFNVPNQLDTKFNIGSLNKLITRIAILQLLQKGQLELDDYVGKHLPDFREDIAKKVKIRHLLSFTSGMGDYFNDRFTTSLGKLRKISDFVPFFIDDPLLSEPGEKWNYSNAGYVVLGLIVEAVSGMDYYEYIRENIYLPAGMKDSDHFEVDSITPNLATGYTRYMPDESLHPSERRSNFFMIGSRGSPAGGGYSTVKDLLLLDKAIAKESLLDSNHSKMVFRPLNVDPDSIPKSVALAGGAPGLTALYIKFIELGYTFIVLSNYDPEDVEPLMEQIRDLVVPKSNQGKVVKMRCDE